ncbi:MAG: SpoIIE family protein phosphatase [Flavobacteriales bacterium]|jgi:serine phosphatase RsbU (regulator of sigma subunit)
MSLRPPIKHYLLLVDDDEITIKVLRHHVHSFIDSNIQVLTFNNGEQALQEVKKIINNGDHLICAVVDYYMNPMMGSDVLFEIDNITPRSKKILLTGAADLRAVTGVIENIQLFRYITKPWQLHDLELTIKEAIRMYLYELEIIERNSELEKIKESLEITVRERTQELERKNAELEEGLQHARNIQELFIPKPHEIQNYFTYSTIFNQPVNNISGDFVYHKQVDNKILVALGDSTGHGLAGALISVMTIEILSSKIPFLSESNGLFKMLCQTNTELKGRLNSDIGSQANQVNVDLTLILIDPEHAKMDWVSLNGNLISIDENNDVQIIHKSRGFMHLGTCKEKINFGQADIKNKHIALFTDGIYDQFNFETSKRLKFSGLLDAIKRGDILQTNQCTIESFFQKWKGSTEQTDDALWLSFKI